MMTDSDNQNKGVQPKETSRISVYRRRFISAAAATQTVDGTVTRYTPNELYRYTQRVGLFADTRMSQGDKNPNLTIQKSMRNIYKASLQYIMGDKPMLNVYKASIQYIIGDMVSQIKGITPPPTSVNDFIHLIDYQNAVSDVRTAFPNHLTDMKTVLTTLYPPTTPEELSVSTDIRLRTLREARAYQETDEGQFDEFVRQCREDGYSDVHLLLEEIYDDETILIDIVDKKVMRWKTAFYKLAKHAFSPDRFINMTEPDATQQDDTPLTESYEDALAAFISSLEAEGIDGGQAFMDAIDPSFDETIFLGRDEKPLVDENGYPVAIPRTEYNKLQSVFAETGIHKIPYQLPPLPRLVERQPQ